MGAENNSCGGAHVALSVLAGVRRAHPVHAAAQYADAQLGGPELVPSVLRGPLQFVRFERLGHVWIQQPRRRHPDCWWPKQLALAQPVSAPGTAWTRACGGR